MHPAVGLLLERLVPKGGAEIGGVHLPEGTVVGYDTIGEMPPSCPNKLLTFCPSMNPWVAARDKATYGIDAYEFRPERWLEADETQLKMMDRNFLAVSLRSAW